MQELAVAAVAVTEAEAALRRAQSVQEATAIRAPFAGRSRRYP